MMALVLACIAGASAAFYFGWYLPRAHDAQLAEQRRKTDLENARRCEADGRKFAANYRQEGVAVDKWLNPQMHFSRKLNACIVEIGSDNMYLDRLHRYAAVIDVYSNRTIIEAYYLVNDNGQLETLRAFGGLDPKKYEAGKDELFSE